MERSAGVLVYRPGASSTPAVEVLLGHLGGPYWSRQDEGAWTIPKGLVEADEDDWSAAQREFEEETGHRVPDGPAADLGVMKQNASKRIHIWAVAGDIDAARCTSGTFELEWPPKTGRIADFPELDRFAWFDLDTAVARIVRGQRPVLIALSTLLGGSA